MDYKFPERTYENYVCNNGPMHPEDLWQTVNLSFAKFSNLECSSLCEENIPNLSGPQIEAVRIIFQRHSQFLPNKERAGFLLGDGTGMGKTRIIAATLLINYYQGRKRHLFISTSSNLLQNLASEFQMLNSPPEFKVISLETFTKHSSGVLFTTYSEVRDKINFIVTSFGRDFDGVLAFDECHMGRSYFKSGVTGKFVARLQYELPLSRVLYSSATALSSPNNIAYLTRLGLWGEGTSFQDSTKFIEILEKRGVAAMEYIACDLTQKGAFICRQLSLKGIKTRLKICNSDERATLIYDYAAETWICIINYALKYKKEVAGSIWQSHQIFFMNLCVSLKMKECLSEAKEALKNGKQVVIGLQSTGESLYLPNHEYDTPYSYLSALLKKTIFSTIKLRRLEDTNEPIDTNESLDYSDVDAEASDTSDCDYHSDQSSELEDASFILHCFRVLDPLLPSNNLDHLISELGGHEIVAELTGRSKRERKAVDSNGRIFYTSVKRNSIIENVKERRLFQKGFKAVAVISNAASVGISLHAERSLKHKEQVVKKRYHITLEFPWSADRLVQQLGRTHRSNQCYPPEYTFLICEIPGETRVIATIASRVAQLAALTQGDHRTGVPLLDKFQVNSELSQAILKKLLNDYLKSGSKILKGLILIGVLKVKNNVVVKTPVCKSFEKFFNRLLGMTINEQRIIYEDFLKIKETLKQSLQENGIKQIVENLTVMSLESHTVSPNVVHHRIIFDRRTSLEDTIPLRTKLYSFFKHQKSGVIFFGHELSKNCWKLHSQEGGAIEHIDSFALSRNFTSLSTKLGERLWTKHFNELPLSLVEYNLMSGDVLAIWTTIEKCLQISVPLTCIKANGKFFFGLLVPNSKVINVQIALLNL